MATPPIRSWRPEGAAKATCVIVHGLAEYSGRYEHVGRRLADGGYAAYAFDLRGHGDAEGWPGKVAGADDWLEDLASVHAHVRADSTSPIFLVAHSMGTLVTIAYLGERGARDVAGVVLSGTALIPGSAIMESLADPSIGIPAEKLSHDPAMNAGYVEDPLIFGDRVPDESRAAGLEILQRAHEAVAKLSLPIFLMHGSDDVICDASGVNFAVERLVSADVTQKIYEGMYHEIFNEVDRDRVLDDMVEWLDAHVKQ
jgi:acylglycerol lipase